MVRPVDLDALRALTRDERIEVALPPDPPAFVLALMETLGVTVTTDPTLVRPACWGADERRRRERETRLERRAKRRQILDWYDAHAR